MDLSSEDVDRYVAAYRDEEPFYPVERESIESLPDALRAREYGPRDAEWVVRWYFRRFLSYPHDERREIEERFAEVDMRTVKPAITEAIAAVDGEFDDADGEPGDGEVDEAGDDYETALSTLTDLPAVDVRVGSAFLTFIAPDRYVPISEPEWATVRELTATDDGVPAIDDSYPDPPTIEAYGRYLEAVRSLAEILDRDLREIHMAIWRLRPEPDAPNDD